jgi:hypothetical protein
MTVSLIHGQQILGSDDCNRVREELANLAVDLAQLDDNIQFFSAILALATQNQAEIALGVLGRKIIEANHQINENILWLLLASVLSRSDITIDSPIHISILGLTTCVKDWQSPIFALLTPALDSFLMVSLEQGTPLIAEQTLDFISTWAESYAKAPRTSEILSRFKSLARSVLEQIDDEELKDEWTEGLVKFEKIAFKASKEKYTDRRIWSSGDDLLKTIYPSQALNFDRNIVDTTKKNIFRLINSCLAALEIAVENHLYKKESRGLSVLIRTDNIKNNIVTNVTNQIQAFLQEVADSLNINDFLTFSFAQATQGSWIQIFHVDLSPNWSNILVKAINSLSSQEDVKNKNDLRIAKSWQEFATRFKSEDIRVDLAVSTRNVEQYFVQSISTEDITLSDVADQSEIRIRLLSSDVPQADSLEKVLVLVSLFIQYKSSIEIIREKFLEESENSSRNYSYYRKASEILGLIDWRSHPTNVSVVLNGLPTEEKKMRLLANQFLSSNIGSSWLKWTNVNDPSDIRSDSAYQFLIEVCPSLSETTAKRRARTLKSWLEAFHQYW